MKKTVSFKIDESNLERFIKRIDALKQKYKNFIAALNVTPTTYKKLRRYKHSLSQNSHDHMLFDANLSDLLDTYLILHREYNELKTDLITSNLLSGVQIKSIETRLIDAQERGYFYFKNLRYPKKYLTLNEFKSKEEELDEKQEQENLRTEIKLNQQQINKYRQTLLQEEIDFNWNMLQCDYLINEGLIKYISAALICTAIYMYQGYKDWADVQILLLQNKNIELEKQVLSNYKKVLPKDEIIEAQIKTNDKDWLMHRFFGLAKRVYGNIVVDKIQEPDRYSNHTPYK